MNQRAAVRTFSHVVGPADFKTVDMPPASDKVPAGDTMEVRT